MKVDGAPIAPHSLLIANHTSWLDILLLAGATDCAFVSKDKLGHSFIHWLADQNATVYVRRSHVKGAKDQAVAIAKALERDKPVALFPEGTTGPGTHLLPFRSTLLEAANFAAKDVAIRPVAIDYGAARAEVGWWQEPGKDNILRILGRRGRPARRHPFARPARPRRQPQAAGAGGRESIAQSLGLTSPPHSLIATANDPKTFKIKNFGCQMNVYDGERMAELLTAQGMAAAARGDDPTWSFSTPAISARKRPKRPIRTSAD